MPLTRLENRVRRLEQGIKRPSAKKQQTKRKPLAFMPPTPDPLRGLGDTGRNDLNIKQEVKALGSAIGQRMKADAERKKIATQGGDYFVMVFESDDQTTKFLKEIGYPSPDDSFIDGTIVADLLEIKLPPAKHSNKLKTKHDQQLTRLVKPDWQLK